MRIAFNPIKAIIQAITFILTAIQKLVAGVAKKRFSQPAPQASQAKIPNKVSVSTPEAPQAAPVVQVAKTLQSVNEAAPQVNSKPVAAQTTPVAAAIPAPTKAAQGTQRPGKLDLSKFSNVTGLPVMAPGQPLPKVKKSNVTAPVAEVVKAPEVAVESNVAAPVAEVAKAPEVAVESKNETSTKKLTATRPKTSGRRLPTREHRTIKAGITIEESGEKVDQSSD